MQKTVLKKHSRKTILCIVLLVSGAIALASGLWIPTKAVLAQQLLQRAWQHSLEAVGHEKGDGTVVRPWPWADTWPVGRLRMARLGVDEIVLEGGSGEVLAFGPGHETGSDTPGGSGHVVLYGHRDTSFAFLEDLRRGDVLVLEGRQGQVNYLVIGTEVVDASNLFLTKEAEGFLSLVTCYPFVQRIPGSTLRYLVTASRLSG